MRWSVEVARAAKVDGWTVVETDGVNDYQGWGVHLLKREREAPTELAEEIACDAAAAGRFQIAEAIREDPENRVKRTEWAVAAWSYGSCSGCDSYEQEWYDGSRDDDYNYYEDTDPRLDTLAWKLFGDLIEECRDEESARMKFSERKGW